jgi:toxin-antitoxin system PIN domain toxin
VILLDTNILIYATIVGQPEFPAANAWLNAQFDSGIRIGMPWQSLLGYVRITTNRGSFEHPEPVTSAWQRVQEWLAVDNVWAPTPTERHADELDRLLRIPGVTHNHVSVAHLAALAIEHGLTVCSADTDFAKFPGVKWMNPLIERA